MKKYRQEVEHEEFIQTIRRTIDKSKKGRKKMEDIELDSFNKKEVNNRDTTEKIKPNRRYGW